MVNLSPFATDHSLKRVPDESKIRDKMIFAASKDSIRKALTGVNREIGATCAEELEEVV